MDKQEFINMCRSDAGNDETLNYVVDLFEEVIPNNCDVDSKKEPKGFYNFMYDYARKNKKSNSFCINPALAKKLAIEYLGIKAANEKVVIKNPGFINFDDFI